MSATLVDRRRASQSLAFSPNSQVLAAGLVDGSVQLWDVDEADWHALACRIANRSLTPEEWAQHLGPEPYRRTCSAVP